MLTENIRGLKTDLLMPRLTILAFAAVCACAKPPVAAAAPDGAKPPVAASAPDAETLAKANYALGYAEGHRRGMCDAWISLRTGFEPGMLASIADAAVWTRVGRRITTTRAALEQDRFCAAVVAEDDRAAAP